MSSKDIDTNYVLHWKSDNKEIMISKETYEIIKELFESLLARYQIGWKESVKGINSVFDCIDLLHYKCHEISLNGDGSYIDFLNWFKVKL